MDSNNKIEPCLSRKSSEGKPQIFTTLRNIDLNLLTIFEAVYVHKGIVNAAKVLNLTPSAISQSIQNCALYSLTHCLFAKARVSLLPHLRCIYMSLSLRDLSPFLRAGYRGSYDKQRNDNYFAPSPRSEPGPSCHLSGD